MINKFSELLDEKIIKRAKKLSVPQLCDGMKELNLKRCGCMDYDISAIDCSMKMVGTAATVQTSNGNNFPVHIATYAIPSQGYVMVVAGEGYKERAYLGDLIMGAAKAAGYIGMVVDGCTRDYEGNLELDFSVFSRGRMPAGPIKTKDGAINVNVNCGGIAVHPGDLIVGDCDGVCAVPRERVLDVLEKAENKKAYEEKRAKAIAEYVAAKKKGLPLPQLAPDWVLDMM